MKSKFLILVLALSSCIHALSNNNSIEIHSEIARDFISEVCESDNDFSKAWLAHENIHWDFYQSVYYSSEFDEQERYKLAQDMRNQKNEICKNIKKFVTNSPDIIKKSTIDIKKVVGHQPKTPIYFSSALQWTDGKGANYKGLKVYVFNARHDSFSSSEKLKSVIAHELIHSAFVAGGKDKSTFPSMLKAVYWEGAAVYGTHLIHPKFKDEIILNMSDKNLDKAKQCEPEIAKEMMSFLDVENISEELMRKYFSGSWKGKCPARMGYYIGYQIFKEAEKNMKASEVLQISQQDFQNIAENYLKNRLSKD